MIRRCGRFDEVEKAFLTHKQLSHQGMTPNGECLSALIYAASKRKEYFATAIEIYRQMDLLKIPIELSVYNNLLFACSKVSDLSTAIGLWQKVLSSADTTLCPNEHTCCNFLWVLASVETMDSKISKRDFVYDMRLEDIVDAANQVYRYVQSQSIPVTPHLLSALLAVYSNSKQKELAEQLFRDICDRYGLARNPFTYELMFKLYDNVCDYDAARAVYSQCIQEGIRLPYEGWRALARAAAL